MKTINLSWILVLALFPFVAQADWKENEDLHTFLKTDSGLVAQQFAASETLLGKQGYAGKNFPEDGKMRVEISADSDGSRRFVAAISYIGEIKGWTCIASLRVEGRVLGAAGNEPKAEDYQAESLTLQDGGCGPQ